MPNHLCHPDDWFYFVESQVNKSLPERLELLPGLRARFGNLLRDEIVSVMLEFDERHYVVAITPIGESVVNRPIDHYIPPQLLDRPDPFEWQSLLPVAHEWVLALDGVDAAHEFGLFTRQALALIERVGDASADRVELQTTLEKAEIARIFYLATARKLAKESAGSIRERIATNVRNKYCARPGNNMVGEECETEWQELGAMLLDGTHQLLEIGIDQLKMTIVEEVKTLSPVDRLALWFESCGYIDDFVSDNSAHESFDLMKDSETLEEIVELIASDLRREMVWDWENKLVEIENASEDE